MSTSELNSAGRARYPNTIVAIHWASVVLVVLAVGFILGRELLDSRSIRHLLVDLHRQCGLLVLILVLPRLLSRLLNGVPAAEEKTPLLLRWMAALAHLAIYAFMLVLPLLGWAMSGAKGQDILLLGVLRLPSLVSTNPDLADTLEQWHGTLAWVFLGLIALHALAALWHHFILRDRTLSKMLPVVGQHDYLASPAPTPFTERN